MANYNVTITNGQGSQAMKKGSYNVVATALGYDTSTLDPKIFNATNEAGSQVFTLSATGTLTINVNETGAAGGTPITSGSIQMTDSSGSINYGQPVTIGTTGDAVFNNVPFDTTGSSIVLYFKQLSSDDNHNVSDEILSVTMNQATVEAYIQNTPLAEQTFTLNDQTYGLPIDGSLEFTSVE